MSEEVINEVASEAPAESQSEAPQLSEREQIEQEAINRYRESQQSQEERESGMPEGYNEDGTQQEELIGGKFKSQEDLLAAYKELESKLGQPKTESEKPVTEAPEDSESPSEDGFSAAKYEQEYAENGSLSDESYADLEKQGFSKAQVDAYIQGQKSYGESVRNAVYDAVGGQENYVEVVNWASDNMPPEIIKEYNDAVDSLDQAKMLRTLEYMNFKKNEAAPSAPRRLEGDAPAAGIQPFASKLEWQNAQSNRLYGKDAKYTNMVDQRYLAARKRGTI
jgi:hypothetical protein